MPRDCGDKNDGGGGGGGSSGGDGGSGRGDNSGYESLSTTSPDPRFPNDNVTNHCFVMYCDYHRCQCLLGEEHEPCNYFKKAFQVICPHAWIERWDDMIERGVFPGNTGPQI